MSTQAVKIAVAENRLDGHDGQIDDLESRMRTMELERHLLRLARRELARTRRELPKIADDAAKRAVELVFEQRDARRQTRFGVRTQLVMTLCSFAMAAAAITALFLR